MTVHDTRPNLLVPGVTKAGTTSLYHHLCAHPSIHGGQGKELNVLGPMRFGNRVTEESAAAVWQTHFADAGAAPFRLDVSPQYFAAGPGLVDRVRGQLAGDARVLVVLRDPVTRLWSAYRMKRAKGRVSSFVDFEDFLDAAIDVRRSGRLGNPDVSTIETFATGWYADHLPLWLEAFDGRVRVVFFEHLATAPARFVASIFDWLSLDSDAVNELNLAPRNLTMRHRNRRVAVAARSVHRRMHPLLSQAPRLTGLARTVYERLNTEPPAETFTACRRAQVRAAYAESIVALRPLLNPDVVGGNPLPAWLTDDVARTAERVNGE